MRIKEHIPNLITLCNLLSGCMAIILLLEYNKPEIAFFFIAFGLFFDFLDGFVARLLGVSSEIGKELDSLADAVSFGVFPSLLILYCFQHYTKYDGLGFMALLIAASSIYRLAKFNLDSTQSKYFMGLATPANTIFAIGIYYWFSIYAGFDPTQDFIILILFVLFSSYILNAKIPMFSLKALKKPLYKNTHLILFILFIMVGGFFMQVLVIAPSIIIYIILSIIFKNQFVNEEIKP